MGAPTGEGLAGGSDSLIVIIDDMTPVVVGGEVFKPKQDNTLLYLKVKN